MVRAPLHPDELEPGLAPEVEQWCAELTGLDPASVPEGELAGLVGALHTLARVATGKATLLAAEATSRGTVKKSGARGTGDWMARVTATTGTTLTPAESLSAGGLAERLAAERALTTHDPTGPMEDLATALAIGAVNVNTAGQVVRETDRTRVHAPHAADDGMRHLLEHAANGATRSQLMDESKKFITEHRTRSNDLTEAARRYHARGLTRWQRQDDGTHLATLVTDDIGRTILDAALRPHGIPTPDPTTGEPDHRTGDQRRHDALITLARQNTQTQDTPAQHTQPQDTPAQPTSEQTGRNLPAMARISILISLHDLLDGRDAQLLDERRWLGIHELRRITCQAELNPIYLDPDGRALDTGRAHRRATEKQRRALDARDRGCTYPGCTMPPCWCEAHHITHWIDGGTTDMHNLALLCTHHHTVAHLNNLTATVGTHVTWDLSPRPSPQGGSSPVMVGLASLQSTRQDHTCESPPRPRLVPGHGPAGSLVPGAVRDRSLAQWPEPGRRWP